MIRTLAITLLLAAGAADAEWARHVIDDSSQGADGARLGDVNGDGLLDVVTPWEEGGAVRVALNPGLEKVKEHWSSVTVGNVGSPEDAMPMDVDGDGRVDVVSACEGDTRAVYVHWAPADPVEGEWVTEVIPVSQGVQQWMYSTALDVNRDGRLDIVSGGKNEGAMLGWFEAPEDRRDLAAWKWHEMTPLGWLMSLEVVDPMRRELLISDRRGSLRGVHKVRPGDDDPYGTWTRVLVGGEDSEVMFLDHGEDYVAWVTRDDGFVVKRHGRTNSIPMPENTGTGKAIKLADLALDGVDDIVISCENAEGKMGLFALMLGEDSSKLEAIGEITGTKFDRMELIDLDGDGDLDVLTCEERENLGVVWYENPHFGAADE